MISLSICILLLIAGYFIYGRYITKVFAPDDRPTPAITENDGVDFVPMPTWKVFLIQLLNIAGTGPIFGALSGALFGPIAYLWIVFGCIFAGAVHDYFCGMLSMRNHGDSISEITGKYLGNGVKTVMRLFSVILLVMCGVVFTNGPAGLLSLLTSDRFGTYFWMWIIIAYYFVATFVPIDKLIGKLYPLFGVCLLAMALGVGSSIMFSGKFTMPELWNNFENLHPQNTPVWSFLFVAIACGAISGFHATQSPMMARCCKSEKVGQQVFYGAMIAEGIIALIWCAAGNTCYDSTQALLDAGAGTSAVVYSICNTTMGKTGSILALFGVIACPISSGDTAYRSARLTLADWFKIDQKPILKRISVALPLFAAGALICHLDYSIVWRYFSWSNQTLAMIALWAAAVYLRRERKNFIPAAIPAIFMSAVSGTYFLTAPECMGILWNAFGITQTVYYPIAVVGGIALALVLGLIFIKKSA